MSQHCGPSHTCGPHTAVLAALPIILDSVVCPTDLSPVPGLIQVAVSEAYSVPGLEQSVHKWFTESVPIPQLINQENSGEVFTLLKPPKSHF